MDPSMRRDESTREPTTTVVADLARHGSSRAATQARIVEAARLLFSERGLDDVSMTAVAAAADVSRKTLYEHVSDKAELVRAIEEAVAAQAAPGIEAAMASRVGPRAKLVAVLEAFSAVPPLLSRRFLDDVKAGFPDVWERIEERRRMLAWLLGSLLEGARRAGEASKGAPSPLLAMILIETLETCLAPESAARSVASVDRVRAALLEWVERAVAPTTPESHP
jgi:AcrR family transcriptional regulator